MQFCGEINVDMASEVSFLSQKRSILPSTEVTNLKKMQYNALINLSYPR